MIIGGSIFLPLHNTAGTHHFAMENNTLFGFLDRSEVGCMLESHRISDFNSFRLGEKSAVDRDKIYQNKIADMLS